MKKYKQKSFTLLSGSIESWHWRITCHIKENGTSGGYGTRHIQNTKEREKRDKGKGSIRATDREWVYRNIPSSIHWETEIHHDWEDGGKMYLVSKAEHILRHRREKQNG